ncbi:Type 1 glutamine amidotransferase-like domain-containing protein [Nonomuraea sp. NPDC005650]|uniref:Type 1 glutamine amidotransferase-like domain-containing protein n=1 Tax=Nonomuraea sp. NPDC005650 TaxID=3157045 RepID=UPI0033B3C625
MPGPLALIGLSDLDTDAKIDADLLARSGGDEVLIIPTAGAEWPREELQRMLEARVELYGRRLGTRVTCPMIFSREEASDPANVALADKARYIMLTGGRPGPLTEILQGTPVWRAIVAAWQAGAVLSGESAGAMALTGRISASLEEDPAADGHSFSWKRPGLGVLPGLRVVPHSDTTKGQHLLTSLLACTPTDVPIVGVPEYAAVVREPDGTWTRLGADGVVVFHEGATHDLRPLHDIEPAPAAGDANH